MNVATSCPHCGKSLNVPQEVVGKIGRCPQCHQTFTVAVSAPETSSANTEDKPSTALTVWKTAMKTTQATGSGLARMGRSAMDWNKARQEEKARKQEEIAKREQEMIEAEKAELAKPIPCPFCGEPILREARKCRHCNEYLDVSLRPGQQQAPQIVINNTNTNTVRANSTAFVGGGGMPFKRFSRIVAFLLSLIMPGLGQVYTGRWVAGITWFVGVAIDYVFFLLLSIGIGNPLFIIPGILTHLLCAIAAGMTNPYK